MVANLNTAEYYDHQSNHNHMMCLDDIEKAQNIRVMMGNNSLVLLQNGTANVLMFIWENR